MPPIYSFRVNLLNRTSIYGNSQPDVSFQNIQTQIESASIYIEGIDHALKHGDTFTVSGQKAIRIKTLADSGRLPYALELFTIPDVEYVSSAVNSYDVSITWTETTYYTYIETKLATEDDSGEWIFSQLIEPTISTTTITAPSDGTFYLRLKHTDNKGNFSVNYIIDAEIVPEAFPVVTTDEIDFNSQLGATCHGTVVSRGSSDITDYGFVWATHTDPTLDDHVIDVDTDNFVGSYSGTAGNGSLPDGVHLYFRAYATNGFGTRYGDNISGFAELCLIKGTRVSLANGNKKIEDITYNDQLLVWNFDDAKFDAAKPVWIVKPFKVSKYSLIKFSDGSELGTITDGKGHRIFNIEKGMFTHMMSSDTPIGTTTFNENGERVTVISKEIVHQETTCYNVITDGHMNLFANSLLTSTGLNNLYPIKNMKFMKEDRNTTRKTNFNVSAKLFNGLRLAEQPSQDGLHEKLKRMTTKQL